MGPPLWTISAVGRCWPAHIFPSLDHSPALQAAQGLPDEALSALRSHAVVRQLAALLEPAVPACSDLHVSE